MPILRLILGDQLNYNHSWFTNIDSDVVYCLFEMRQETDYVRHHIQKIVAFFLAMRQFCSHLKSEGHKVKYLTISNPENKQTLEANIRALIEEFQIDKFEYLLPDEYRLDQQLKAISQSLEIPTEVFDTEHFLTTRDELDKFFKGKKSYLLESFYRYLRKSYNILMEGDKPYSGKWNYDKENRKSLPKAYDVPKPFIISESVKEILEEIKDQDIQYIGTIEANKFIWVTNRSLALKQLKDFVANMLQDFGNYQDAMTKEHWSLFHSRLSFLMNVKILSPLEVINTAIREWEKRKTEISLSQIEGFVRQILGWREYMRGVYWAHMPDYENLNFFNHNSELPQWFWTGETMMHCLSHSIGQSLNYAYAHHIQRLMVTGNFALLAGVNPDEVDAWYLGIYIDALQWVEITNTRGMSQFADGGIVGTKPYISSASYIHKMSDYCNSCYYDKKLKVGPKACPFNSLYWRFYAIHRDKLSKNPRVSMMYRVWDKMDPDIQKTYLQQAEEYLKNIDNL